MENSKKIKNENVFCENCKFYDKSSEFGCKKKIKINYNGEQTYYHLNYYNNDNNNCEYYIAKRFVFKFDNWFTRINNYLSFKNILLLKFDTYTVVLRIMLKGLQLLYRNLNSVIKNDEFHTNNYKLEELNKTITILKKIINFDYINASIHKSNNDNAQLIDDSIEQVLINSEKLKNEDWDKFCLLLNNNMRNWWK